MKLLRTIKRIGGGENPSLAIDLTRFRSVYESERINKTSAFTLAEMMVVMLILSVILAAMAPVMTTRYKSKPNDSSPWKYEANNRLNAYFGGPNSIAMIGQNEFQSTDNKAKLLIKLDNADADYNFLAFKRGDNNLGRLYINNDGGLMFGSTTGRLGANANSVGRRSEASGVNATAFGSVAKANKDAATAVGSSVTASGVSSLAVGTSSNATADNSIAIGNAANGSGASAVAIGQSLTGSGANSVTIGQSSTGSGASSIAIGNTATGSGTSSISLGANSIASATNSIAIGDNAKVEDLSTTILSNGAIAIGQGAQAKAERAIAIGNRTYVADGKLSTGSIAIGATDGGVTGEGSIAIGDNAKARGSIYKDGHASVISIGKNASAEGYHTIAIGENAKANGYSNKYSSYGSAFGDYNSDWGFSSIAIGANANAIVYCKSVSGPAAGYKSSYKTNAIAIGADAKANAAEAMAIGINAEADANSPGSIAIGVNAKANTPKTEEGIDGYSVAIGTNAQATGSYSIAIGSDTGGSNSRGNDWTQASGTNSIAIGHKAFVRGNNNIGIGANACKYATGANKICIGSMGPGGGTHNNWASDNVERIFIGGRSRFNGETSVLEIHNETSRYNVDSGGQSANNPEPTVVINGNLLVRGFLATGLQEHNSNYLAESGATKVVRDNHKGWELQWTGPSLQIPDKVYQHGYVYSDRRLKYVGKENKSGLDKIRQLKVFNYTFKKDAKKEPHVGIIAQDLQKVFPNAVKKGADGFLTIRMEDMFYAVINAIKELDAKYQAQEKRINELEKRIEKLEAKVK